MQVMCFMDVRTLLEFLRCVVIYHGWLASQIASRGAIAEARTCHDRTAQSFQYRRRLTGSRRKAPARRRPGGGAGRDLSGLRPGQCHPAAALEGRPSCQAAGLALRPGAALLLRISSNNNGLYMKKAPHDTNYLSSFLKA